MARILYLVETTGHGGTEAVILQLLQALKPPAFAPMLGAVGDGWLPQAAREAGAQVIPLDARSRYDGWDLTAVPRLARLMYRHRVDLVHCFLFHMSVLGTAAALLARRPAIASLRSVHYDLARPYRRLAWHWAGRAAASVTAVSDQARRLLCAQARLALDRVEVIPNGVDTTRFRPGPRQGLLQPLGVPPDALIVGSVGRLHPVKGHRCLLEAGARVAATHACCHFVVAGECSPSAKLELQALAAKLGLQGRFHLLGPRQDIPDLLRELDVFVLPSLSEGMSNALLEAMATGLPTIATAVGGNPQVLEHGKSGLLIAPRDPKALAEALVRLVEDPPLCARLGSAARDRVCRDFSLSAMIQRHRALYGALLARKAERRSHLWSRHRASGEVSGRPSAELPRPLLPD